MPHYNVTVAMSGTPNPTGWYNVKAYGAVGDGSTDDRAAIQSACDACSAASGGMVFFPRGTYIIEYSSGVGIDLSGLSGITIEGPGATIKTADNQCIDSSAYYLILSDASTSDIVIRNIKIDGNGENNSTFTVADAITAVGSNIKIDSVDIANPSDSGIMFSATGESSITNCHIDGGSVGSDAPPHAAWSSGATSDVGIYVNDGRTGAGDSGSAEIGYDTGDENSTNSVISNNKIKRFRNGGIALKRVVTQAVVVNNTISDCGNGITFENASYTADSSLKCIVSGNKISNIGWINSGTAGRGVNLRWSHFSEVSGNYIDNCTNTSIKVEGSQRCVINSNVVIGADTVNGSAQVGILLIARPDGVPANVYSTHNTVVGNSVSNHHYSGIEFDNTQYANENEGNIVYGNAVYGNARTGGSEYKDYYIGIAAADDTTPSVLGKKVLRTPQNTGATAITQLDDAYAGQIVIVMNTTATNPSTIADSATFNLASGANWSPAVAGDNITLFTTDGSTWFEASRSSM